jgi:hypothetical protein
MDLIVQPVGERIVRDTRWTLNLPGSGAVARFGLIDRRIARRGGTESVVPRVAAPNRSMWACLGPARRAPSPFVRPIEPHHLVT